MFRQVDVRFLALASIAAALWSLLVVALASCSATRSPALGGPSEESTPSPASTITAPTTPSPASTPIEPGTGPISLTIWGPPQFSPGETDESARVLQVQYDIFVTDNAGVEVHYVPKAPYGESGVVSFLLGASYAAPSTLPDVAIVDAFELHQLVREKLAQPLGGLIADELSADLFPFAREACTFDGELMGIQFEADIEHLIYYTRALEEPPATWADLFVNPVSYTFPAGGEGALVNDSFLIQYLAQGGQLLDEEGRPALQSSPLQRVLRLYDALRTWDVTPLRVLELSNLEDCWKAYTEGNIAISHISSRRYLTSRSVMRDTTFAPLPTETGVAATMSRGWAYVIVTETPQRQEAAARLIEWLMSPSYLAEWSQVSNHIPMRPSALPLTGWPGDYIDFLQDQLENVFYRPSTPEFERIARALQVAVEDVLSGENTPRQATNQVIDALE